MNLRKPADKSTGISSRLFETSKTKKINLNGIEKTVENRPPVNQALTNTFQLRKNSFVNSIKEPTNLEKRLFQKPSKSRSLVKKEGEPTRPILPPESASSIRVENQTGLARPKVQSQQDLNLYSVFRGVNLGKDKSKDLDGTRAKGSQIQIYKEAILPKGGGSWFGKSLNQPKPRSPAKQSSEKQITTALKIDPSGTTKRIPVPLKSPMSSSITRTLSKKSLVDGSKISSIFEKKAEKADHRVKTETGKDENRSLSNHGKGNTFNLSFGHATASARPSADARLASLLGRPNRKISSSTSVKPEEEGAKPKVVEYSQSTSAFYADPLTMTAPLGRKTSTEGGTNENSKSPFLASQKTEKLDTDNEMAALAVELCRTTPIGNVVQNNPNKVRDKLKKLVVLTGHERPAVSRVASCENSNISSKFQPKVKQSLSHFNRDDRCMSQQPDQREGKISMLPKLDLSNDLVFRKNRLLDEIGLKRHAKTIEAKCDDDHDMSCPPTSNRLDEGAINLVMTEYGDDDLSAIQDANQFRVSFVSPGPDIKTPEIAPSNQSMKPSQVLMAQKGTVFSFQKAQEASKGASSRSVELSEGMKLTKVDFGPGTTGQLQAQQTAEFKPSRASGSDTNVALDYSPDITERAIAFAEAEPQTNRTLRDSNTGRQSAQAAIYDSLKEQISRSQSTRNLTYKIKVMFDQWEAESPAPRFPFGTLPECYKMMDQIGKGCFGTVNMAIQRLTGLPVALKMISKSSVLRDKSSDKIRQEIRFLKTVSSEKYLAKLLEVFEDDRNIYIVLEYYPNGDLITFFKDRELLAEEELKQLFLKIVLGVERLHRLSIIHRDIKMDNILLDKNFEPVISDFGISSFYDPEKPIMDTGGTPAYLAPEVIKAAGGICYKTDVWGLGVLLYALAFGYVPFEGEDIQDLYRAILVGKFQFPSRRTCSPELIDLISRMIVVDVKRRYTISDVLKHPWMARSITRHLQMMSEVEKVDRIHERSKKEAIIRHLNDAGFGLDYIYESIANRQFNHVTSCYENLMRHIQREA